MKRLFIAVKLIPDDNLLKVYYSLQKAFQHDRIRWVPSENFHLTLKFLGNTPEEKISTISEVISNTVTSFKPINVKIVKSGVFGSKYKPRVIWFGIEENNQLQKLGMELFNNLNDVGFPKDRQNFVPHLTIGRITKIADKQLFNNEFRKVSNMFLQSTTIDKVILFESILTSKVPEYNVIESFSLKL